MEPAIILESLATIKQEPLLYPLFVALTATTLFLLLLTIYAFSRKNKLQKSIDSVKNAAIEAGRSKDIFLANVSHETRTPMNAIIGLSHILLQTNLDTSQKSNVTKIKRSAEHLLAVSNDILDYSKIEAGKLEIESIPIEVGSFITDLANMMELNAVEKRLDLIFDTAVDLPERFDGDALRISQVLINLLNNAIKFTDKGEILLQVRRIKDSDGERLEFSVKDTGIGLTQEQMEKLFKAFDQADNSVSRKYGGTGLGLAISKELVEKMGGKLLVKSTFRKGSTFFFSLPLINPVDTTERVINRHNRLLHNKSILIFEQNMISANLLLMTLKNFRALPKIIQDETELLTLLKQRSYDGMIIDSRILKSLQHAKAISERCQNIVVLNYEPIDITHSYLKIKSNLYKPFSTMTLLHAMHDIFGREIIQNTIQTQNLTLDDILVLKGARILLAEDNEGNAMVVEGLIEDSGIELTIVENGQKAVQAIFDESTPYDLILMDINMPVMDGYVATSIIREYQQFDNIPIVAMTANIAESDVNKSKSYGMQAHLSKPVDVSEFYKTLLKFIPAKIKPEAVVKPKKKAQNQISASSLENLPGIDIQDGLSRLNGNTKSYQNILKKFAEIFKDANQKFLGYYNTQDFDEGRAFAHNLKGLAGNIGAKEIHLLAKELEENFKHESGDFIPLIETIDTQLSPLLQAIDALKKEESSTPKKEMDSKKVIALLKEVYHAAKKKKALDMKKGFEKLLDYEWPTNYKEKIDTLNNNIQAYKFDKILKDIELMMQQIKNASGEIQ